MINKSDLVKAFTIVSWICAVSIVIIVIISTIDRVIIDKFRPPESRENPGEFIANTVKLSQNAGFGSKSNMDALIHRLKYLYITVANIARLDSATESTILDNLHKCMLEAQSSEDRREAALCLGIIGNRVSIPFLEQALSDEDPLVREEANASLKIINGEQIEGGLGVTRVGGQVRSHGLGGLGVRY